MTMLLTLYRKQQQDIDAHSQHPQHPYFIRPGSAIRRLEQTNPIQTDGYYWGESVEYSTAVQCTVEWSLLTLTELSLEICLRISSFTDDVQPVYKPTNTSTNVIWIRSCSAHSEPMSSHAIGGLAGRCSSERRTDGMAAILKEYPHIRNMILFWSRSAAGCY